MRRTGLLWCFAVLLVAVAIHLAFRERRSEFGTVEPTASTGKASAAGIRQTTVPPTAFPTDVAVSKAVRLFEPALPTNVAELDRLLPAPSRDVHYVRTDRAAVEAKESPFWQRPGEGRVAFPLPSGGVMTVVIDDSEMLGANRFTSRGHVEGQPESRALFAYNEGFLTASVETQEHAYALRPATADASQLYEVDPSLVPPCGGTRTPPLVSHALASVVRQKLAQADLAQASGEVAVQAAAAAQSSVIDLLMVYTQAVKPTLSGAARTAALRSEFDAAVLRVNSDLAASQVSARVRLAGMVETVYDPDSGTTAQADFQNTALTALSKTDDGIMDEIHAARDRVGADVVMLLHNRSDTVSAGLSYVLVNPSSKDSSAALFNADYAFAVVQYGTVAGSSVVSHELGHVFGCAHARGDSGTGTDQDGAFSYSYGYRFFGRDGVRYRDIMAYYPGTQLGYYSNPNLIVPAPVSVAIGVPRGQTGTEADCAGTIEQTAFEVSTYRLATPATSAGTLVNVSTRAYVGSGDAVLIGGFVVSDGAEKRILVRAAGPALRPYGVGDALANPILRVYTGTTEIASNDNWGQQDAAGVLAAVQQVGAFSFASGSADSALVLRLGKGGYTAVVEDAGGAPGSALVEVYDVDKTGSKVVNLATRGFADIGREMYAGFVVQGAAGTTKRILIRVLGPTLGRAPFNISGAMDDPLLDLHLQDTGALLVRNDDWSSSTTDGDPFHPLVKRYSEVQVAATGLAPSNRREPCVMLDLPPGNYSAVVQPFQRLDKAPIQVAAPGVCIVEVYEITP